MGKFFQNSKFTLLHYPLKKIFIIGCDIMLKLGTECQNCLPKLRFFYFLYVLMRGKGKSNKKSKLQKFSYTTLQIIIQWFFLCNCVLHAQCTFEWWVLCIFQIYLQKLTLIEFLYLQKRVQQKIILLIWLTCNTAYSLIFLNFNIHPFADNAL